MKCRIDEIGRHRGLKCFYSNYVGSKQGYHSENVNKLGGDILSQINKIYNTDCIEAMKYIDDEMILNISEFCKWDITLNIQELRKQYERIVNNGN